MGFQLSPGEPGTTSPGNAARANVIHKEVASQPSHALAAGSSALSQSDVGCNVRIRGGGRWRRQGRTGPTRRALCRGSRSFRDPDGMHWILAGRKRRRTGVGRRAPDRNHRGRRLDKGGVTKLVQSIQRLGADTTGDRIPRLRAQALEGAA